MADTTDDSLEPAPTYERTFDPTEPPSEAVVTAVAAVSGESVTTLEPLYNAIEPDALDSLLAHAQRTGSPGEHRISFSYAGFDVQVCGDGVVRLE